MLAKLVDRSLLLQLRDGPLRQQVSRRLRSAVYPSYWSTQSPDKFAVVEAETKRTQSYKELDDQSRRLANSLHDMGLRPGDHVAVLMENHLRYLEVVWGCLLAGVDVTPVSSYATADDVAYVLIDSGARVLIASDQVRRVADQLPGLVRTCERWLMLGSASAAYESYDEVLASARADEVSPEGPLGEYMLYSSGTTGRPKGIARQPTGRRIADGTIANRMLTRLFSVDSTAVYLSPAPLYHGAPLGFCVGVTSLGGTVVILRKFEAEVALRAISDNRVTHSQWVPTMFNRMLSLDEDIRQQYDVSSQQVAIHSAAPCPVHVKKQMFAWWGPIIHEYYSGSEDVGLTYASPSDWLTHPGTVGKPLGVKVHICAEDGSELPPGEDGLVYFESKRPSFDYHGDPNKSQKARHPQEPSWVTLDDIGRVDEDGFLYLTDRASFMIISGGVNIYPKEIEDVLLTEPRVLDVAVIGVPDDDMGERVLAVVEAVPSAPVDEMEAALRGLARDQLAGPKRPRDYDFVSELPRLATGKVVKKELRARYVSGLKPESESSA